ncbi:MAG: hypothetical protein WBH35_06625, partial [Bacillota bacterium]
MRINVLLIVALIVLVLGPSGAHAEFTVEPVSSGDVQYELSNFRFLDYQGDEAVSVDFSAYVNTSFLGRDIPVSSIELLMYDADLTHPTPRSVKAIKLNSSTFGVVLDLDPDGEIVETPQSGVKVRKIAVDSKKSHKGSLLFILPDSWRFIHGLKIGDAVTPIRDDGSKYIDIESFGPEQLQQTLEAVTVPT